MHRAEHEVHKNVPETRYTCVHLDALRGCWTFRCFKWLLDLPSSTKASDSLFLIMRREDCLGFQVCTRFPLSMATSASLNLSDTNGCAVWLFFTDFLALYPVFIAKDYSGKPR